MIATLFFLASAVTSTTPDIDVDTKLQMIAEKVNATHPNDGKFMWSDAVAGPHSFSVNIVALRAIDPISDADGQAQMRRETCGNPKLRPLMDRQGVVFTLSLSAPNWTSTIRAKVSKTDCSDTLVVSGGTPSATVASNKPQSATASIAGATSQTPRETDAQIEDRLTHAMTVYMVASACQPWLDLHQVDTAQMLDTATKFANRADIKSSLDYAIKQGKQLRSRMSETECLRLMETVGTK